MIRCLGRAVDPRVGRLTAALCALAAALLLTLGQPPELAAQTTGSNTLLQPGDRLVIVIPERVDAEALTVTIDEGGEVALGIYGRVRLAGLTEREALNTLQRHLGSFLRSTSGVRLSVAQRGMLVLVSGAVASPGLFPIPTSGDVWTAIQIAGGALDGADLTRVVLLRGGDVVETVDVRAFLTRASPRPLPALSAGDTIFVSADATLSGTIGAAGVTIPAEWDGRIFVLGAVNSPGLYTRSPGLTVLTALALAGGPAEGAALSDARLLTQSGSERVDLAAKLVSPPNTLNPIPDEGGAILFVPRLDTGDVNAFSDGIAVLGNLNTPRFIHTPEALPLMEVLARAGGPMESADVKRCYHVHQGPGYTVASGYNLQRFFRRGGALGTVKVHPGDVIYLQPQRPNAWETVIGGLSDVAVIATAALLFVTLNNQLNSGE